MLKAFFLQYQMRAKFPLCRLFVKLKTTGPVEEDEGPFWRVRCNRNLKNQASLNLLGFFEILMQNILH